MDMTEAQEKSNYYNENLDFWEVAWEKVKTPYKKLPDLAYIETIPKVFKKYGCNNILDIACGSGWLAIYLASHGFKATGVDISKSAIDLANGWLAEDKIENVDFVMADMFNMDFLEDTFDGILINAAFEHLNYERGEEFLNNIKPFIREDGLMFGVFDKVATGNKGEFYTLEDGSRVYTDDARKGMLMRNYSDDELKELFERTGWEIKSWYKNDLESRIIEAVNKKSK